MRSKLFFGAGSEYRSQRDQDLENEATGSNPWQYGGPRIPMHGTLPQTKAKTEMECGYCGKRHRYARKFCGITCTRAFIKSQQRKGTFADD